MHLAMKNVLFPRTLLCAAACAAIFAPTFAATSARAVAPSAPTPAGPSQSAPTAEGAKAKAEETGPDKLSVTEHAITLGGKALKYRATAGRLGVNDDEGKPKANFFFVAYERLPAET